MIQPLPPLVHLHDLSYSGTGQRLIKHRRVTFLTAGTLGSLCVPARF